MTTAYLAGQRQRPITTETSNITRTGLIGAHLPFESLRRLHEALHKHIDVRGPEHHNGKIHRKMRVMKSPPVGNESHEQEKMTHRRRRRSSTAYPSRIG